MKRLLERYEAEGGRTLIKIAGHPVDPSILEELHRELEVWAGGKKSSGVNRERPSIQAGASPNASPVSDCSL